MFTSGALTRWGGAPWPVRAFAVDDCSVQLVWAASPAEGLKIEVGDFVAHPEPSRPVELVLDNGGVRAAEAKRPRRAGGQDWARSYVSGRRRLDPAWPAGPGGVVIDGLAPGTTYDIVASAAGIPAFVAGQFRTLTPPGGRLLSQFATVSDIHIGENAFGVLMRIHDPEERPTPREQLSSDPERPGQARTGHVWRACWRRPGPRYLLSQGRPGGYRRGGGVGCAIDGG